MTSCYFSWGKPLLFSTETFKAVLVEKVCSWTALGFFNLLSLYIASATLDIKNFFFPLLEKLL